MIITILAVITMAVIIIIATAIVNSTKKSRIKFKF